MDDPEYACFIEHGRYPSCCRATDATFEMLIEGSRISCHFVSSSNGNNPTVSNNEGDDTLETLPGKTGCPLALSEQ